MKLISYSADSPLATVECGRNLGKLLIPGDFLALTGDLGSGKTRFAKGIALGVGVPDNETVCSPSYTILNIHHGRIPFYHFDLYRLTDSAQIDDLGFDEYFEGNGACIVEWAERLGDQIPPSALKIVFSINGPEQRTLHFHASGDRSIELLGLLCSALPHKSV